MNQPVLCNILVELIKERGKESNKKHLLITRKEKEKEMVTKRNKAPFTNGHESHQKQENKHYL